MKLQLNNNKLKKIAAYSSVSLAVILIAIKLFAFLMTNSLAIFSSFIDSITDLFASLASFIAIYFSTKPANKNHRYGFGKTEALSAFLQSMLITISAIYIIFDGINKFINPIIITNTSIGLLVMIICTIATILLISLQIYVAKKTNSLAIKADLAHYSIDVITNIVVIISLILTKTINQNYFDIISAIIISIYLLYNAYKIAKDAVNLIIDRELAPEIKDIVINIIEKNINVLGVHDLRTRNLGDKYYFEMHIELDGNISLYTAHKITEEIEVNILKEFPNSQILIHQDPSGILEDRLDHQIEGVCKL